MVPGHALSEAGAHLEALLVAGALLVLGVVFYVQKIAKPLVSVGLILVALVIATGSVVIGGDEPAPADVTVTILAPLDGETVDAGNAVRVEAKLEGDDGAAHLHIYVDGEIVSMPQGTGADVYLEPGTHTITVEYVGADHAGFADPVEDEVTVTAR